MNSEIAPPVESMIMDEAATATKNVKKIPKRIHKAEREKMKREHLNELFLALTNSLELPEQNTNTGKASVLIEATRFVKDMLAQVKCLQDENAALSSESQYVTVERNELKDENAALVAEIEKLRTELKSTVSEMQLDLNVGPPENQNGGWALHVHGSNGPVVFIPQPGQSQGQIFDPLHIAAFYSSVEAYPQQLISKQVSAVTKPHARYPSPADAWPSQVLEKQQ